MKKKVLLVLILLIASLAFIYAEEGASQADNFYMASNFISMANKEGFGQIKALRHFTPAIRAYVDDLSITERALLFESHKKSWEVPGVTNFFLGFGIGSAIMGDLPGFLTGLLGDIVGIMFSCISIPYLSVSYYDYGYSDSNSSLAYYYESHSIGTGLLTTGLLVLTAVRVCGFVLPWLFSNSYNETLSEAIFGDKNAYKTRTIFAPIIEEDGKLGLQVGASIEF